nr:hypothetical protein [Methylobacterium sp. L1A1]
MMDLDKIYKEIEDGAARIFLLTKAIIRENGPVYSSDFIYLGSLKRGLSLASGFRVLMKDENYTCAAALLRMQIDTAARIHALSYVDNPNRLADLLLAGERFDKLTDKDGHKLKDFYLIKKLASIAPWVSLVYERTSNFVHLSVAHFFSSISSTNEDGGFSISIGPDDPHIDPRLYEEMLAAFAEATRLVAQVAENHVVSRNVQIQQAINNREWEFRNATSDDENT